MYPKKLTQDLKSEHIIAIRSRNDPDLMATNAMERSNGMDARV